MSDMKDAVVHQDHERRISRLEFTMEGVSSKMDELKEIVEADGKENKALLNRLIGHHLDTNRFKLSQFWKLIFNISGAGGLLGVVIYAVIQFFGGK